ncbi:MAG: hypothetical protein AAGC63_12520 [Propionicimonas sp.]|nr:hypothetical protein [Propionicimonas sp.]
MTRHDAPVSGGAKVPGADFSVREFARSANGSHRAALRLDAYADSPLDSDTLAEVALLSRLERSALRYLRSVLVTPTHSDARMTAFLVTWAYEKYWLADALELVVAAHPDQPSSPGGESPGARLRLAWHAVGERFEPIRESVVTNLIGDDVIAVHCVTGALDEWLTQAAYQRLAETTGHEQLRDTLAGLLAVKRRHSAFFTTQARDRLTGSPRAQSLARRRLRRTAVPLGSQDEPARLLSRLLGGWITSADLAAIDRRLDGYPGLAGLRLVARTAERATRRAGRAPAVTGEPTR